MTEPLWGPLVTDAGVKFRVWAPDHPDLRVEIVDGRGSVIRALPLTDEGEGFRAAFDPLARPGDLYQYRLDRDRVFPDPASRAQNGSVHGPSVVVDSRGFPWTDAAWSRPAFRDLVIYELHVGAFTPEGTFAAAIGKLAHLRRLHINAIEIMPLGDFPGGRGWGYDGVQPFAPAACYGPPDDLRRLVDAAHAHGIAVILDVVYNHFGPDGSYMGEYVPAFYHSAHTTPWGAAFNIDGPHAGPIRAFFKENPVYWMEEFHVDGFRLDATHEIRDDSVPHLLQEITGLVHSRGRYVIAEDARNEARVITPSPQGGLGFDGVWADDFHHCAAVALTGERESYYQDFLGTLPEFVETMRHGWLYQGQFSEACGAARGTPCRGLPPQAFVHCISNHDQTGNRAFGDRIQTRISPAGYRALSMLICLTPYTPMLFMGQEWSASAPFVFFSDHHEHLGPLICEGRRKEFAGFSAFQHSELLTQIPDPQAESTFLMSKLDWRETGEAPYSGVLALYETCLRLRAECPVFRPRDHSGWEVAEMACGAAAVRLGDFLLIIHLWQSGGGALRDEPVAALPEGRRWSLRLSSSEKRFSGHEAHSFDAAAQSLRFTTHEVLLLEAVAG